MSKNVHLSAEISPEQWRLLEQTQHKHHLESLDDALAFIVSQYGVLASVREDQALKQQLVQDALALQSTQQSTQDVSDAEKLAETLLEALFAYTKKTASKREESGYERLKEAYAQALEHWDASGEAEVWDGATADGLPAENW
jgi:hypothetical protein